MMFFETCGHPIRAGRTQSMRSEIWISACERGAPRRTPVAGCPTSMTTSAGRRRTWERWRSGSRLRFTAQGADVKYTIRKGEIIYEAKWYETRNQNPSFTRCCVHATFCGRARAVAKSFRWQEPEGLESECVSGIVFSRGWGHSRPVGKGPLASVLCRR